MGTTSDRPLWQWTASEVAMATRSGAVSCTEVVAASLERLHTVNPRLNAVTLDLGDEALTAAAHLDEARVAGTPPGPLHGVPLTIKDNVDVRGQRTPNGLPALAGLLAPDDSPVVRNLVEAGAVIVGRTNTPELSLRPTTSNPLYGLTLNPWDARISCGGSSGGAAVAVATGMGALAHGNDIGGSVRIPALHCGVTALKPTPGRIPAFLPSALVERTLLQTLMSVQGPLARTVADLRLALHSMAARDPRDPWWVPAPLEGPRVSARVGVIRGVPGLPTHPAVAVALDTAARALADGGYEVVEVEPPDLLRVRDLTLRLLATDLELQLGPVVDTLVSDQMRAYWAAIRELAAPHDTVAGYVEGLAARTTVQRRWLALLEEHPVLLSPLLTGGLLEVDEDVRSAEDTARTWGSMTLSLAMNFLGLPAVQVPTGLFDGLPTGVQLVAGRFREDCCLAAAEVVEKAVGPLTHELWARETTAPA